MDQPPPAKSWSPEASFVRESVAPPARVTSVSHLSRSPSHSSVATIYTLDRMVYTCSDLPTKYKLMELLNKPAFENSKEAETSVCEFVARHTNATVLTQALKLCPQVHTISSSEKQIPDGSIVVGDATVFILEVESGGSWESTTLKLAIHLCKMLASLRNRRGCDSKTCLSGFYFPFSKCECVVQVTVRWIDERFQFHETHEHLELPDVVPRLVEVYENNVRLWSSSAGEYHQPGLNYPISKTYLRKFGDDARQLMSGQSIVIMSRSARCVYKKNLDPSEESRLMHLLWDTTHCGRQHPQFGLPVSIMKVDKNIMIVFDLYRPPLTRKEIREHPLWFSHSLIKAVRALHSMGLAHLDIRPENICVCSSNSEVVLIDLDRYQMCSDSAIALQAKYGDVDMYFVPDVSWTFEQLDWKQVGILYRELFPHSAEHCFVKTLVDEGEMQRYDKYKKKTTNKL